MPAGYWIRYVSSGTYTITPQIRTEPYTVSGNYMDFRLPIDGNIPAVLAIEATSEGRITSDEKIERVVGGLRSISRGKTFSQLLT